MPYKWFQRNVRGISGNFKRNSERPVREKVSEKTSPVDVVSTVKIQSSILISLLIWEIHIDKLKMS